MKKNVYPFTGMIRCGKCHANYVHRAGTYQNHYVCPTFKNKGKAFCDMPTIRDEIIEEKVCEVLGIQKFNEKVFKEKIDYIVMLEDFIMEFVFKNGNKVQVKWSHKSRSLSWTPEMKKKARDDGRKGNLIKQSQKEKK